MSLINVLDFVGVAFLVAAAFQANFRRVSSLGAGLALIAIAHLVVPAI